MSKKEKIYKTIKQDINMLEYPLWMQDEKLPSKIAEDTGFVWQDREGYFYRCGYKVPTKLDIIFLMYILYRSQQEGWKEEIELSRYEILKSCGYTSCRPADYERLEDSLERWKMVGVKFKGTFYDGKRYITLSFGIIDTWKIDEQTRRLKIRFNREWLTRIKNSSYFKYLNFDQIRSLRSPLAMRLYEILVKNFQNRDEWSINAKNLAKKIPMKEKAVAHIVPKIKAAVNRINIKTNFRVSLLIERPRRGEAFFIFKKVAQNETPQILEKSNDKNFEDQLNKLLALIPNSHKNKKTVLDMIQKYLRKYGEEYVRRNILYTNQKLRNKRSYRVFLEKSLRNDWALDWWEDNIDERSNLNLSNKEREEWEYEQFLRKKVEEYLSSLSSDKIQELEKQAIEELPENLREIPSFVRMQMRLIVRKQIQIKNSPLFKEKVA